MVIVVKVSASRYGVWLGSVGIVSVIVQSVVEWCFRFSDVLNMAFSALHKVDDKFAFTCGVMEDGV